jgi:HPt (histidine-containing phosphotransfer) domain-containing protein
MLLVKPLKDFMNWIDLPLDLNTLKILSDGDMDFALELLQIYHDDCLPYVQTLREGIATQNYGQIYEAAHYLTGSSSNIGATQTLNSARKLELLSRSQTEGAYGDLLTDIEDHLRQIRHWLQGKDLTLTLEQPSEHSPARS